MKFANELHRDDTVSGTDNSAPDLLAGLRIDLGVLRKNVNVVRSFLGENIGVIGVVKADAYGHGLVRVSQTLLASGVDAVGVANITEAKTLRAAGVRDRILIIYPILAANSDDAVELGVDITVTSLSLLHVIENAARKLAIRARIHLQIETGMHHYGAEPREAMQMVQVIRRSQFLTFAGLSTHFATADTDIDFLKQQYNVFMDVLRDMATMNVTPEVIHIANSAAIDNFPQSWCIESYRQILPNVRVSVRAGCLFYGTYKSKRLDLQTEYVVKSLTANILEIKELQKHDRIGYFGTFKLRKDSTIAIVSVGWGANGFFPKDGSGLVCGKRVPIVGAISANTCALDVSGIECAVGSEVVLMGEMYQDAIKIEELAEQHDMFINRLISILGASNPRIYLSE